MLRIDPSGSQGELGIKLVHPLDSRVETSKSPPGRVVHGVARFDFPGVAGNGKLVVLGDARSA